MFAIRSWRRTTKEIPAWVVDWYNQRGEASENRLKELKTGFAMERMPSGNTKANAVFVRRAKARQKLFNDINTYAVENLPSSGK